MVATVERSFNTNNTYDPRFGVGGHQPLQYDLLASVYERVWDHGCHFTVTFSNPTHDGMWVGYRVRAYTNTVSTSGQSLEYLQEMRDCTLLPCNNTGTQSQTFTGFVPNARVLGINGPQYANLEYSHTTGGSPAVLVLLEPFAIHTVVGETGVIRCNVKLTYDSQFTNPISAPQS